MTYMFRIGYIHAQTQRVSHISATQISSHGTTKLDMYQGQHSYKNMAHRFLDALPIVYLYKKIVIFYIPSGNLT